MNGDFGDIAPWKAIVASVVLAVIVAATLWGVGSRRRLALAIGMWLAAAAGLVIGPAGFELVGERELVTIRPLGGVLLTWIGLIVGLQCAAPIMARVPGTLLRWTAVDAVLCGGLAGSAAVAILALRLGEDFKAVNAAMAAVIVAATAVGWSGDTRSLHLASGRHGQAISALVRAGSGLLGLVSVTVFGIAASLTDYDRSGFLRMSLGDGLVVVGTAAATASLVAVGSWLLLEKLARRPGERLVVTLGSLAVLGGTAEWLHTSPLLTGLLAGALLANLPGQSVRALSDRIREAEAVLGMALYMLAGLLLGPVDGPVLLALVGVLFATRLILKPLAIRGAGLASEFGRPAIHLAARRQAPIAVAIAVAGALLQATQLRRTILAATLLTGVSMLALHLVSRARRSE